MNSDDPKNVLRDIAKIVAKHTGVSADDIIARGRLGNVVIARFITIENLLEQLPLLPVPTLAELFGRTVGWARFAMAQKIVDTRFKKIKQAIRHDVIASRK